MPSAFKVLLNELIVIVTQEHRLNVTGFNFFHAAELFVSAVKGQFSVAVCAHFGAKIRDGPVS